MAKTRTNGGLTLVEALIAIALVALVLSVVSTTLIIMVRSFSEIGRTRALITSGSTALERLARESRNAKNINASSVLGLDPSTLVLDTVAADGSDTTVTFSLMSGVLTVGQAGITASLTPAYLTVDSFLVRPLITPVSRALKVDLSLSDNRGERLEIILHDTIILRGSY